MVRISCAGRPKYGCPLSWNPARSVGTLDGCCVLAKIVMWSFWTSAIAHVGPIEKWPLYAYLYVALTTFAELASAASTLPTFVVKRAGLVVFVSPACRSQLQKLPEPESFGSDFQTTLSCAAAWIASYSFGATTARKLFTWTTCAFGMWAIDFGSTLIGKWFCDVTA